MFTPLFRSGKKVSCRYFLPLLACIVTLLSSPLHAQIPMSGRLQPLLGVREWWLVQVGASGNVHGLNPFQVEPALRLGLGIYRHHTTVAFEAGSLDCEGLGDCTGRTPSYRVRFEYCPGNLVNFASIYFFGSHMWVDDMNGFGGGVGALGLIPNSPVRTHWDVNMNLLNGPGADGEESTDMFAGFAVGISVLL